MPSSKILVRPRLQSRLLPFSLYVAYHAEKLAPCVGEHEEAMDHAKAAKEHSKLAHKRTETEHELSHESGPARGWPPLRSSAAPSVFSALRRS
jgi:hypothetical protein